MNFVARANNHITKQFFWPHCVKTIFWFSICSHVCKYLPPYTSLCHNTVVRLPRCHRALCCFPNKEARLQNTSPASPWWRHLRCQICRKSPQKRLLHHFGNEINLSLRRWLRRNWHRLRCNDCMFWWRLELHPPSFLFYQCLPSSVCRYYL